MAKKKKKSTITILPQIDKWRKKDGESIRICDMDDDHLVNTLRWLKRKAQKEYKNTIVIAFDSYKSGKDEKDKKDKIILLEAINNRNLWFPFTGEIFTRMELDAKRRGIFDWEKNSIPYDYGKDTNGLIKDDWNGIRNKIRVTNKFKLIRFD